MGFVITIFLVLVAAVVWLYLLKNMFFRYNKIVYRWYSKIRSYANTSRVSFLFYSKSAGCSFKNVCRVSVKVGRKQDPICITDEKLKHFVHSSEVLQCPEVLLLSALLSMLLSRCLYTHIHNSHIDKSENYTMVVDGYIYHGC